jgi:hypothetical protein
MSNVWSKMVRKHPVPLKLKRATKTPRFGNIEIRLPLQTTCFEPKHIVLELSKTHPEVVFTAEYQGEDAAYLCTCVGGEIAFFDRIPRR